MGLRKINTIGMEQANKVMHLSAMAYNLKKYLKFTQKRVKSRAGMLVLTCFIKKTWSEAKGVFLKAFKNQEIGIS